jgi:UTP-glucose-1-phosphate uridylyltransferase
MDKTLLVLAAGMGSRYGGLKQLDAVGPSGEVVLDYSVHDALRAGFNKVVFVIRRDLEVEFGKKVTSRYDARAAIEIAYQELEDVPEGFELPSGRQKPWGTGHAIRAARHLIHEPFLVVNADDFYGMEAYSKMADFLDKPLNGLRMGMVGYPLASTLSAHGVVSRGICTVAENQSLIEVEEHTGIQRQDGKITGQDSSGHVRELSGSELVSMNFWGFTPEIFPYLEELFSKFLTSGAIESPKSEFYIPSAVSEIIASGAAPASVLSSAGPWFGVTYKQDREAVTAALSQMVKDKFYPTPLWKHIS